MKVIFGAGKVVFKHWKIACVILVGLLLFWFMSKWFKSRQKSKRKKTINQHCASIPESESIFVSVPSYRDPQCQETILDLFEKAACPFRITVGVCQQNYPIDEDVLEGYKRLSKKGVHDFSNRIRIHRMSADDAKGPMYARHLIEKHLFKGEKYYMVIDSHTLFTPHWDLKIVEMFNKCRQWSAKPILTMYPEDFKPYNRSWSMPNYDNQPPSYLRFKKFNDKTGLVEIEGPRFKRTTTDPSVSLLWAGCFAFGYGTQVQEVPFDPHCGYTFLGEEISMAARLWTHGYDFYHPTKMIVFHMWERRRPTFWQQFNGSSELHRARKEEEAEGYKRLQCLMGIRNDGTVLSPYGLGQKRSLQEYMNFLGIDFKTRRFSTMSGLMGVPKTVKSHEVLARFGTWKEFKKTQENMQQYINKHHQDLSLLENARQ